jgi:hypothetical protein
MHNEQRLATTSLGDRRADLVGRVLLRAVRGLPTCSAPVPAWIDRGSTADRHDGAGVGRRKQPASAGPRDHHDLRYANPTPICLQGACVRRRAEKRTAQFTVGGRLRAGWWSMESEPVAVGRVGFPQGRLATADLTGVRNTNAARGVGPGGWMHADRQQAWKQCSRKVLSEAGVRCRDGTGRQPCAAARCLF